MEDGAETNGGSATSDEKAPTNGGSATSNKETDRQPSLNSLTPVAPTSGRSTTSHAVTDHRPSLNSLALVRKAIPRTNISSDDIEEWRHAVYKGVLLENNTQAHLARLYNNNKTLTISNRDYLGRSFTSQWIYQKFWVDEKLHKNCFLVLPKACDIAGGDEESCWSWITKEEKCFPMAVDIRVPESKELSWLLIQGRFKTRALSPKITYEVAFVVKFNRTDRIELWTELVLPDGTIETGEDYLMEELEEKWINLPAGEFMMGPETVGTIHFALGGSLDPEEEGLILGAVRIHPKD